MNTQSNKMSSTGPITLKTQTFRTKTNKNYIVLPLSKCDNCDILAKIDLMFCQEKGIKNVICLSTRLGNIVNKN